MATLLLLLLVLCADLHIRKQRLNVNIPQQYKDDVVYKLAPSGNLPGTYICHCAAGCFMPRKQCCLTST